MTGMMADVRMSTRYNQGNFAGRTIACGRLVIRIIFARDLKISDDRSPHVQYEAGPFTLSEVFEIASIRSLE